MMTDESSWIIISEWNLLIVKYWAKAGVMERIRFRVRLRKTNEAINKNDFKIFMNPSLSDSRFRNLQSEMD
jgi:hypothetical protein